MKTTRQRLDWLELGRGLAALGVVLAHYDPWRNVGLVPPFGLRPSVLGNAGVEFFFILSGFIIAFVHGGDLSRRGALPGYAWRRAVRVFPTYWLVLVFALLFNQTLQNPDYRVDLTFAYVLKQLVFWPGGELLIGPGWTLRHELLFYAVFAIAIWRAAVGLPLFVFWMAAATINLLFVGLPPGQVYDPLGIVLHHYNIDFAIGVLIALAAARGRPGVPLLAAAGATLILSVALAMGVQGDGVMLSLLYKAAFAAIVSAAVIASQRGVAVPRIGITLGAMSYSLYISHISTGVVVRGGLRRAVGWNAVWPIPRLLVEVGVALLAAWLLHKWFEVPVLRRARGRYADARRPEIAAEA